MNLVLPDMAKETVEGFHGGLVLELMTKAPESEIDAVCGSAEAAAADLGLPLADYVPEEHYLLHVANMRRRWAISLLNAVNRPHDLSAE